MSSDQSNYSSVVTKLFIVHEGEQTNEFVDEEDEVRGMLKLVLCIND